MKITDRISVILFTVCVLLLSVLIPMSSMISSKDFYAENLTDTGIYPDEGYASEVYYIDGKSTQTAMLTKEHFDSIFEHFVSYFNHEKDSFALTLNDVVLNGKITNDVSIFGEKAVSHMADVRTLFHLCNTVKIVCCFLFVVCGIYMITRRKHVQSKLFSSSLIPILAFVIPVILFLIASVIVHLCSDGAYYFNTLWEMMHSLFFPFSPEKASGSFFNDALTCILSLDFFLGIVIELVLYLVAFTSLWLTIAFFISRKAKQKTLQN